MFVGGWCYLQNISWPNILELKDDKQNMWFSMKIKSVAI